LWVPYGIWQRVRVCLVLWRASSQARIQAWAAQACFHEAKLDLIGWLHYLRLVSK
jgi:hypothetical protein